MQERRDEPPILAASFGLLVLRVGLGIVFAMHGWQKLFQMEIPGVAGFFGTIGVPVPEVAALLVSLVELIGGVALVIGLGTRWVAIPLAIDMLVAALLVHVWSGFFAPAGVEMVLLPLAGSIALLLAGPGALAIDGLLRKPASQPVTTVSSERLSAVTGHRRL
jgi:putative oxidoreductase